MKRSCSIAQPKPSGYEALVQSVVDYDIEPTWQQRLGLCLVEEEQGTPLYDPVALALLFEGLHGRDVTVEQARAAVARLVAVAAGEAEPEARACEEDGTLACVTDISVVGWLQMQRLDDCPDVIRVEVESFH